MAQWYNRSGGYLEALFTSRVQVSDALLKGTLPCREVEWMMEGWMRAAAVKSVWVVVGDVSVRDALCQAVCRTSKSVCC
jgi:hypothetical protein